MADSNKKTLNITGTSGKTYDLNELQQDSRLSADRDLVVQVHKYKKGENPNPANLQIGQIWLSKLVVDDK